MVYRTFQTPIRLGTLFNDAFQTRINFCIFVIKYKIVSLVEFSCFFDV